MQKLIQKFPNLEDKSQEKFLEGYFKQKVFFPEPCENYPGTQEQWLAQIEAATFTKTAIAMILKAQELVKGYAIPRVHMSIRNLIRATQILTWLMEFKVPTEVSTHDGKFHTFQNIFLPRPDFAARSIDDRIKEAKYLMKSALIMAVTISYMLQLPSAGHVSMGRYKEDLRKNFVESIVEVWELSRWDMENRVHRFFRVEEWLGPDGILRQSLGHLWSRANIPRGYAKTTALMENFYCVILSVMNKIPLLITGKESSTNFFLLKSF